MIEMIYAFIIGFYGTFAICYNVVNPDEALNNAAKTGVPFLVLLLVGLFFIDYTVTAISTHLSIAVFGAVSGVLLSLYLEGTYTWLWRLIHPASAPTEFIRAGQRGTIMQAPKKMSAALMGTSTAGFAVQGLDVKTTALIKLAMFAFKSDRYTIITLENSLKLGDGRRYYAFQKLVAESQFERGLKDIIHPYWRAINGNHSSARLMFTNLCQLARESRNTNKYTVNRLLDIGKSLGLSPEDMGIAIRNVRG